MTRKRILLQCRLYHPTQAREATPQIRHSRGDPDARSCWKPDHPSRHSIAVRSTTTSTFPATRRVPFKSLISRVPDRRRQSPSFTVSTDRSFATFTGQSCAPALLPTCPSLHHLRHQHTSSPSTPRRPAPL